MTAHPEISSVEPANAGLGARISVCLLTYNHVNVIESTLRSVLRQTIDGYEVIVSDDCSSDGTWELVCQLAEQDKRIRPIRPPHNLGMAGNANFAVAHADRPYIALLHHDDIYREDLLEKWGAVIEAHPGIGFVFNAYGVHDSDFVYREHFEGECVEGPWLLRQHLLPRWGCPVRGTAMISRAAWLEVGGMRERFGLLADVDLWMRLARDRSVGYVAEPVIAIRHARPTYYPKIYSGEEWSWPRQVYLYDIHATNRLETLDRRTLAGLWHWQVFRWRLNRETAKWLAYAVVRRKWIMIEKSDQSETPDDFLALRAVRWILRAFAPSSRSAAS